MKKISGWTKLLLDNIALLCIATIIKFAHSVEDFLQGCSCRDWNEVSRKVSRIGLWEFEGYEDGRV
ncbi:Imm8 family immunity protein [Pseudomonas rhizosphaerae]|uniref:Imm8 family immunity protein n=1 Tax=Pseudomonas rhizosphaerae TaxID=216142 RepID=UPI002B48B6A7|nr:Imm8 family immunity protein [Pseudomonas rhizosphaerae]MEB2873020.1 Imm8 family immunity protein [Pseudomonas rhizosphaerae]